MKKLLLLGAVAFVSLAITGCSCPFMDDKDCGKDAKCEAKIECKCCKDCTGKKDCKCCKDCKCGIAKCDAPAVSVKCDAPAVTTTPAK